jgi:hypothetical protein
MHDSRPDPFRGIQAIEREGVVSKAAVSAMAVGTLVAATVGGA